MTLFVRLFFLAAILAIFGGVYLTAASCPPGQIAVRNIWNWPVCVPGGAAP